MSAFFIEPTTAADYLFLRGQAFHAFGRYKRTNNGRFLLTAWVAAHKAKPLAPPGDADFLDLFDRLAQHQAGLAERLLDWHPVRRDVSGNLVSLKVAAGLDKASTTRSATSSAKAEIAVLARLFALQRCEKALMSGREPECKTSQDFERISGTAAGLSLTTARKAWDGWILQRPIDGSDEAAYLVRVKVRPVKPTVPARKTGKRAAPLKPKALREQRLSNRQK
jgi:hypothetical protein